MIGGYVAPSGPVGNLKFKAENRQRIGGTKLGRDCEGSFTKLGRPQAVLGSQKFGENMIRKTAQWRKATGKCRKADGKALLSRCKRQTSLTHNATKPKLAVHVGC